MWHRLLSVILVVSLGLAAAGPALADLERSSDNPQAWWWLHGVSVQQVTDHINANNARLSITTVHSVVKRAVKALQLHRSLSAHDFRHFRATQLLREGMPIEVVQEYLGHADISTTRTIYAPVLGVHIVSDWLNNVDVDPRKAMQQTDTMGD